MIARSFAIASLLSLFVAAPVVAVGCAAPVSSDAESVGESQDDLTAAASELTGSYSAEHAAKGGFVELDLKSNGHYTAKLDPNGTIVCVTAPCVLPESGTWSASHHAGGYRLHINPAGAASRLYDATKSAGPSSVVLTLSHGGVTQTLSAAGSPAAKSCGGFAGLPCGAGETCIDDPSDGCDPAHGGADCPGICTTAKPAKKSCGGFAGLPCGAGETCVDDPSDGCDPAHGGADCPGICQ